MQKIIIKNFGPVKDAEIEIKKVLILIGEQASGKSTIAKLIYFFKTLVRKLKFTDIYTDDIDIDSYISYLIQEIFYNFFGSTLNLPDFEITFYYNLEENKYLQLKLGKDKELSANFSVSFFNDNFNNNVKSKLESYDENQKCFNHFNEEEQKFELLFDNPQDQELRKLLNDVFENTQPDNPLFVIAGRNATVSYSDLFEKYLFASVKNSVEENDEKFLNLKTQTIDEALMLGFIQRVSYIKAYLRKFDGFQGLISRLTTISPLMELMQKNKAEKVQQMVKNQLNKKEEKKIFLTTKVIKLIESILKGKYFIDNDGEKIILNNQEKIYLNNASSGQQEVIRILQDVFILIYLNRKVLRVIEEPEAHLFPVAQKQLVELLALMVNYQPENQLIITTHSPYILSVFSNLLFASRVVEKNPAAEAEVQEIIDKDCWLNPQEFSAYSLGNHSFPEEMQYCEPIFDNKMGNIKQNYLDTVSEILGAEFSQLYSIHGKTFKRR